MATTLTAKTRGRGMTFVDARYVTEYGIGKGKQERRFSFQTHKPGPGSDKELNRASTKVLSIRI